MDFISSVPAVKADKEPIEIMMEEDVYFTFSEQQDEQELYRELNGRLGHLEAGFDVEWEELESIRDQASRFQVCVEEQRDVQRRVDWLNRLYWVKERMGEVTTPEQAAELRASLAPVQYCSMKKELLAELESFHHLHSDKMEQLMKEAGESFINLGKRGRNHVLVNAGKDAAIEKIHELTEQLEQTVKNLQSIHCPKKMSEALENLPLKSFEILADNEKEMVAKSLLKRGIPGGLVALDRQIKNEWKRITANENREFARVPAAVTVSSDLIEVERL